MLHPVSQTTATTTVKYLSPGHNIISQRLELIENKLSIIECDKKTYEINHFSEFIKDNKSKILDFPVGDGRLDALLAKSASLLNDINDNNGMGLDNAESNRKLSELMGDVESLIRTENQYKSVEQRVKDEVKRSCEKVEKEVNRSSEKVSKEVKRFMNRW